MSMEFGIVSDLKLIFVFIVYGRFVTNAKVLIAFGNGKNVKRVGLNALQRLKIRKLSTLS